MKHKSLLFTCLLFLSIHLYAQVPIGFSDQLVSTNWHQAEGVVFDGNGQQYVWEKRGHVYVVDTFGVRVITPLIDIKEEVGDWWDNGLTTVVLDPNFLTNGYLYLYYTVDRHYLLYYGTGTYHPDSNKYFDATIARLTRYTADPATNFHTLIPGSRKILLGETKKTGVPVTSVSHNGGGLVFGKDGSLLLAIGDGASHMFVDAGGTGSLSYSAQASADSILRPKECIGAYRSQLLDSYNGKIIRIDANTGLGISSNPYYDAGNPNSIPSKVWCLGLRNPFRMTLRPGTGSTDTNAANPGVFYLGDVNWNTWEEMDVVKDGNMNFGWPIYEGLTITPGYGYTYVQNMDAPNPLYNGTTCNQQYFYFQDLIKQATLIPNPPFLNPCDNNYTIPGNIPTFIHDRPPIDWRHGSDRTRTGIFIGNNAAEIDIDSAASPVQGTSFRGACSMGGVWYTGNKFPPAYQNTYYHGDFSNSWIKQFGFDGNDDLMNVNPFAGGTTSVVNINVNDKDGCIYYVAFDPSGNPGTQIRKICYTAGLNNPPIAVATSDTIYGPGSSLLVNFTGSNSTDPEAHALTYHWDFGTGISGDTSNLPDPTFTFTAAPGVPTVYTVTLTVTDDKPQSTIATINIYLNNTPPVVTITSFTNGDLYSVAHVTTLPLQANVTDAEHSPSQLFYEWQTRLRHNIHFHGYPIDTNKTTSTQIYGEGCDQFSTYYYEVVLKVTDAGGLSTTANGFLYPTCSQPIAEIFTDSALCVGQTITFTDPAVGLPDNWMWYFQGGTPSTSTDRSPMVTYNTKGTYDVKLVVSNSFGTDSITKTAYIFVDSLMQFSLGNDTAVCGGITLDPGVTNGQYDWSTGATTQTAYVSSDGDASVTVTSSIGCINSDTINITIKPLPNVVSSPDTITICAGHSIMLSATGGITYNWSTSSTGSSITVSPTQTTTYSVTGHGANGCNKTDTSRVMVDPCTSIEDVSSTNISIAPNPFNNSFIIYGGNIVLNDAQINIYNVIGEKVNNYQLSRLNNNVQVTFNGLSIGIYYVTIQTKENDTPVIKKIVHQ